MGAARSDQVSGPTPHSGNPATTRKGSGLASDLKIISVSSKLAKLQGAAYRRAVRRFYRFQAGMGVEMPLLLGEVDRAESAESPANTGFSCSAAMFRSHAIA